MSETRNKKAALWVPSLYFAEGLPYMAVNILSVIFYKVIGLDNDEIAFYTSSFYIPWLIKPLWSPLTEMFKNSKFWVTFCQFLCGILFAGVAYFIPADNAVKYTLVFFWVAAFASATHDIAADGLYIKALDKDTQAFWVGIRNTFYRLSMIFCQGGLVILAGELTDKYQDAKFAWQIVFAIFAGLMALLAVYHKFTLPLGEEKQDGEKDKNFLKPFVTFFKKDGILLIIGFLLLYRLSEAQLTKIAPLFLLDSLENGGLELSTSELGFINGTVGLIAMILGGILGGIFIANQGLNKSLIIMILALNLPDLFYAYMAWAQPQNFFAVSSMVFIEQFGYGFGFTAYTVYMMQISAGENSTSHYAVCTAFMAAGMMLPGMVSGYLQTLFGYKMFFVWVVLCAVPSVATALKIKKLPPTSPNHHL
ncbi:MAG: MFS transporter [Bacteroidales bacterium]|nr:MFS transporter [Bacteroidales bacterium]